MPACCSSGRAPSRAGTRRWQASDPERAVVAGHEGLSQGMPFLLPSPPLSPAPVLSSLPLIVAGAGNSHV